MYFFLNALIPKIARLPLACAPLLCLMAVCCLSSVASQALAHAEKFHAAVLCKDKAQEVTVTQDTTRMDCFDDVFVYEVDWSKKWHEGIGQALYYAASERRPNGEQYLPGLILICAHSKRSKPVNLSTCQTHYERAQRAFLHHGIKGQIWFCLNEARRREHCVTKRFGF